MLGIGWGESHCNNFLHSNRGRRVADVQEFTSALQKQVIQFQVLGKTLSGSQFWCCLLRLVNQFPEFGILILIQNK